MHYAFELPAADNMISQGPAGPLAYAVIRPTRARLVLHSGSINGNPRGLLHLQSVSDVKKKKFPNR